MMQFDTIREVITATCGVCLIPGDPRNLIKDPQRSTLHVIGSAFLVTATTVISNRHVLLGLREIQVAWAVPDDNLYLWFVYPRAGGWQEGYCKIKKHGVLLNKDLDIGIIEFVRRPEPEFEACKPLTPADDLALSVGEQVIVTGFPYGTDAFKDPSGHLIRVGCLVQQGFLSGFAPTSFVNPSAIKELVLDVRTAPGMSGGPVVRISDGKVVGVHYAGIEATLAMAIAMDKTRLNHWLAAAVGGDKATPYRKR